MESGCSNNGQEMSSKQDLLQGLSFMKQGTSVNSEVRVDQKIKNYLKQMCKTNYFYLEIF